VGTGKHESRRLRSNRADRCLIVGKAYESIRAGLLSAIADAAARSSRPHSEAIIELLRDDPAFADEYLRVAEAQADQEGGREALLSAQRLVAEARGKGR